MNLDDRNHKQLATFLDYLPLKATSGGTSALERSESESKTATQSQQQQHNSFDSSPDGTGDSGYNSDDEDPSGSTSESMEFSSDGAIDSSSSSGVEIEAIEDLDERIEFIQAKREILERASNILQRDDEELLTISKATRQHQARQHHEKERHFQSSSIQMNLQPIQPRGERSSSPSSLSSLEMDGPPAPIWNEARDILEKINGTSPTTGKVDRNLMKKAMMSKSTLSSRKRQPETPVDPEIALEGNVSMLGSKAFDVNNSLARCDEGTQKQVASVSESQGDDTPTKSLLVVPSISASSERNHWMAQALIQSTQQRLQAYETSSKKRPRRLLSGSSSSASWRVLPPTFGNGNSNVLVPANQSFAQVIDLQQATAPQTCEARLVTQATPPFLIVYANRAFLQMVEPNDDTLKQQDGTTAPNQDALLNCGSPPTILGRPVESLLQVLAINEQPEDIPEAVNESVVAAALGNAAVVCDSSSSATVKQETETVLNVEKDKKPQALGSSGLPKRVFLNPPRPQESNLPTSNDPPLWLDSVLMPIQKPCLLRIVPVVDRSLKVSNRSRHRSSCVMSHIMVQVQEQKEQEPDKNLMIRPQPLRVVLRHSDSGSSNNTEEPENTTDHSNKKPRLLGTVG